MATKKKPTLNYAELATLLAKAANIVNDRPIGVKNVTEDELVPLTVNQLLLGHTSSTPPPDSELPEEDFRAAKTYLDSLTQMWWKLWMEQGFPTLLPYYRLCRVSKLLPSDDGLVRMVEVQLGNKKLTKRNLPGKDLVTAVQRLVLLVPAGELQQGPLTI